MQNEVRQTTRECRIGRWTTAIVLLVLGIALAGGGIRLLSLGGSWYYLIGGIALVIIALLLLARRGFLATGLYALFLLGSTLWALAEVGFDWWPLVPRLAIWWVLGLWMLAPWSGRTAQPTSSTSTTSTAPSAQSERRGRFPCIALSVVAALTAMAGIASLFCDRYDIRGTLSLTKNVAQTPAIPAVAPGDWPSYGRDQLGDRYSPLTQITPANAGQLKQAWVIHTGDKKGAGDPIETTNENTPIKVGNTLFICTPHSKVLAVDAATGALRWQFDPKITSPVGFSHFEHMTCRGVSYHDEAAYTGQPPSAKACAHRIFLPTADARLIALDADTGKPCDDFGNHGTVDLRANIGTFTPGGYYSTSPPMVTRNLVIIGGHVTDNESTNEPSGVMRAYDVHDGHLVWNWDAGHPDDTAPIAPDKRYTRNSPNMWSVASVDERLGMIYLPMGNQTPDQWGGNRTAQAERFGAGVVALDLATGHVKWVYQFTHHDLWDMDVGGQPTLMDLQTSNGVKPALIASTKQGSIYVLDRRTGTPLMPITETPVPQGAASGDHAAPTQPVSALNFNPPRVRESDMWGATPYDQLWCRIDFRSLRYDGAFTPPSEQGSLVFPGNFGAFDWGGVAVDPVRQILFGNPNYMAFISQLVPRDKVPSLEHEHGSETSGIKLAKGIPFAIALKPFLSPLGIPCQAPPWGYVAGVDLTSGKTVWKHKNGTIRDSAPIPLPFKLGVPSLGGTIVTAGGVGFLSGTLDYYLRAYDIATGKQLWQARLPAGGQATPMTYADSSGKQYVLVVAGGHGSLGTRTGDAVVAYSLP